MKIGYAKINITPDIGVPLSGYIGIRESIGIHQPLYAKAIVLNHQQKNYIWLSLDLIAIDHLFLTCFKNKLKQHQLQFEDVEVFATHTHSGPCGTCDIKDLKNILGSANNKYIEELAEKSVFAVKNAILDFSKFKINVAQSNLKNFAASRHHKDIPIPNKLTTILLSRNCKEDILLYHFACHPTILHQDNLEISSDFIGSIDNYLKGKYTNTMFLNGSCGDISTRFTRKESSKAELSRMSLLVAEQILLSLKKTTEIKLSEYKAYHFCYNLKKKKMGSVEEAKFMLDEAKKKLEIGINQDVPYQELRLLESYYEGAQANYHLVKYGDNSTNQEIQLSIIKLGIYFIICIPAELFHALEEQIICKHCLVINYANGYHAYIADENAYKQHYYEAMMSYYAPNEGEKLIHFINNKLLEL